MSDIKEVKIGNQIWMAENLAVKTFRNGDPVEQLQEQKDWDKNNKNTKPAYCEPEKLKHEKSGLIYNGFALADERGLAPEGWRLPNHKDINELKAYMSDNGFDSVSALLSSDVEWKGLDENVKPNDLGLTLLPVESRMHIGFFGGIDKITLGVSPQIEPFKAYYKLLLYPTYAIAKLSVSTMDGGEGVSVRCIKV
ncbi:fibrobacter succinogenes major paralogous domain-containing protein [Flavobacteriales bacterium]|nr:fibrobacter succinogenes major paralogous domain-containing protein [Flavobacteriales bacterium]